MPNWHQKNRLCYNSRLTEQQFRAVLKGYCEGISASQSSAEFKEAGISISRQTIAKYYKKISLAILDERETYPWWTVNHWSEFSDNQIEEIRKIVYDQERILGTLRKEFYEHFGKSISADSRTYIDVLRETSKSLNGLPKKTFWVYLARACELALHIDEGFDYPILAMYQTQLDMFKYKEPYLFNRKASPAIRSEQKEKIREWKERDYPDYNYWDGVSPYKHTGEEEILREREVKIRQLSPENQKKYRRINFLRNFIHKDEKS